VLGATALACVSGFAAFSVQVLAQTVEDIAPEVPAGSQMLLEADTLVYDNDAQTVTAVGGVQIDYAGNRLVAQRVVYDRKSSRLIARGGVQIVDSTGTKIYSEEIDVTDDFGEGFANALRVETVDKTYFAAESAKRESGILTTFNNGVYTACAPCEDDPAKPPIWRIKARKIIWNGEAKTVRFERARFEFFGFSLATLPAFEIADPTVKRKTGFLLPSFSQSNELGFGVRVPFYLALSPTYDLTFRGTGYTKQGFLGESEWRQRFDNGQYSIRLAGIYQADPDAFDYDTVDSGPPGDPNRLRGMVGTKGHFEINPRWDFGWRALLQSDKDFANTYAIEDYSDYVFRSEVYLVGLSGRNYFDLRAMQFQVQEDVPDGNPDAIDNLQGAALPSFDYSYTPEEPVLGGELNIDVNSRMIHRYAADNELNIPAIPGIEGNTGRLTAEAEWKKTIVTDSGFVVTPLFHLQGDANFADMASVSSNGIDAMAGLLNVAADIRSAYYRYMATAGLELRWPLLFSSTSATHVLEPMAQIFARPDEPYAEKLGLTNEDSQSFVFDASTLFERDKFAGYDRIEGGTRANLGLRYSSTYANGWTSNAIFGQSYQLAGRNSFNSPDLVNIGVESGLETAASDYVGLVGFATPFGVSASAGARFDEETFDVRRTEFKAGVNTEAIALSARYAFIDAQPLYGFPEDRQEVSVGSSARFNENWRVFAAGTYDLEESSLISGALGFGYDDECFSYLLSMSETRNATTDEVQRSFGFNISLRTLGDFGSNNAAFAQ
jgi:LPS-assembly protein